LFSNRSYTAVAEGIDIVDHCPGVDESDEIFNDEDDILFRQYALVVSKIETEFFVNPVATNFPEIVALLTEEKTLDNIAGSLFVRSFGIPELTIDVFNSFFLGVRSILRECIENDVVVSDVDIVA